MTVVLSQLEQLLCLLCFLTSSSSELHLKSANDVVSSVMSSLPTPDGLDTWSICSSALHR